MKFRRIVASFLLLAVIGGVAVGLSVWKRGSQERAATAGANQPEPAESIGIAVAKPRQHRRSTTAIGTVRAIRSITLRNELAGTVRKSGLVPGKIVEAGDLLVEQDTSVELADLKAREAQLALTETVLGRIKQMTQQSAASATELDRATAERDVALANVARDKAVIARKTILAPFKARIGMADLHPGQYLEEGTQLTTLQGVDESSHVDFSVAQVVAAGLKEGDDVEVWSGDEPAAIPAKVVAVDARVDPMTRNAAVRVRVANNAAPAPGSSVRVRVPVGPPMAAVTVPANALRRAAGGDHVFVIANDPTGKPRAAAKPVKAGELVGDDVLIVEGLKAGDRVAAAGSFKLREAALVTIAEPPPPATVAAGR